MSVGIFLTVQAAGIFLLLLNKNKFLPLPSDCARKYENLSNKKGN